jgi:hypothetical protein
MSQKIKTSVEIDGSLSASQIQNATVDTDKFLVSDGGVVKYRTGTEMLSDLGVTVGTANHVQHSVKASVAINKGQAVYVTDADGTNMIVGLASNAAEATSSKTMGLLNATVGINGFADVITEGLLSGLNTSTAVVGNPVWLGTGGNLIYGLANKPYAPNHLVFIGIVTRVNANNGEIFVKVQNGFELEELHNVDLQTTPPANNDILTYEGGTVNLWKNKTIPAVLGYTPYNASNPNGYISSYTETDPTVPSHVKSITTTEKTNWNTAYGWGNHASAGYLTTALAASTYASLTGIYSNPSWITGLAWSKITGAPAFITSYTETDTLASVTGRGATTSTRPTFNGGVTIYNSNLLLDFSGNIGGIQWGVNPYIQGVANGGFEIRDNTNGSSRFTISSGGSVTANVDMRSPIFYDSNNTGYYVDPASTSNLNSVTINSASTLYNGLSIVRSGGGSDPYGALSVSAPSADNYAYMGFTRNGVVGMAMGIDTSNNYWIGTSGGGHNAIRTGTYMTVSGGGNVTAIGDFRAPIFYDSNNTGYYVDPASNSNLNTGTFQGRMYYSNYLVSNNQGGLMGDYNVTGTAAKCIWTIGESWPLGNMYGLAYEYNGSYYHHLALKESGTTYARLGFGTAGAYFTGGVTSGTRMDSPIFYDSNDSAYYVDPASTSNLYGLQVTGASNKYLFINPGTGYEAMVRVQGGSGSSWYSGKRTTSTTQAGTDGFHFYSDAGGDTVVGFGTDGTIKAKGDVVAYSSSDRQLKDNITPIQNALDKVKLIGGYTFDWNDKQSIYKGHDIGVIAQEIEAVIPEVVTTRDTGFKAVKYEKIVPLLIEAIKDQQIQIEELKELVNQLINK